MSNIQFALAAVSAVVAGVGLFSAIWYRVEKLQAEQKKKKEVYGTWDLLNRPVIRVARDKGAVFVGHHDLVTTDRER